MAKLTGNIGSLVKDAAKSDKREQLLPETKSQSKSTPSEEKRYQKPWPASLKSVRELYVRVRLELPESLNEEIDRYFFERKLKGKNEFLFHAIKEYAQKKGIKWPKK